jgi:hypothetical protein
MKLGMYVMPPEAIATPYFKKFVPSVNSITEVSEIISYCFFTHKHWCFFQTCHIRYSLKAVRKDKSGSVGRAVCACMMEICRLTICPRNQQKRTKNLSQCAYTGSLSKYSNGNFLDMTQNCCPEHSAFDVLQTLWVSLRFAMNWSSLYTESWHAA